jgi:hypothetical protein
VRVITSKEDLRILELENLESEGRRLWARAVELGDVKEAVKLTRILVRLNREKKAVAEDLKR